jgi:hypothetical protein
MGSVAREQASRFPEYSARKKSRHEMFDPEAARLHVLLRHNKLKRALHVRGQLRVVQLMGDNKGIPLLTATFMKISSDKPATAACT